MEPHGPYSVVVAFPLVAGYSERLLLPRHWWSNTGAFFDSLSQRSTSVTETSNRHFCQQLLQRRLHGDWPGGSESPDTQRAKPFCCPAEGERVPASWQNGLVPLYIASGPFFLLKFPSIISFFLFSSFFSFFFPFFSLPKPFSLLMALPPDVALFINLLWNHMWLTINAVVLS